MLDQENLYQLIFQEHWTKILSLLYTHKTYIASDPMLQHAGKTFEGVFFNKVKDYDISRRDIEENLDILYVLNHGKFYQLSADNYKTLIIELVKRKPLKEAVNYAKSFPDDETCKRAIEEFEKQKVSDADNNSTSTKTLPMNWIEIYNRIFELINNQRDVATYFSGPRFINTVKEFEAYFPDYNQFIEQRNREGKSTSRKIFYYDILIGLKEEVRIKVIDRILEILNPFQTTKVEKVQELLGRKVPVENITPNRNSAQTNTPNPIVFISYSWDNDMHKEWVLNLADRLCSDGIDVILDRYYLKPGKNLPHFVENSISRAERIIIIFTQNYKLKADKRTGGVGYEYSIMNADLYNNQTTNEKVIPLLKAGSKEESIPTFMQQFIHIDSRNDEKFENSYVDLLREIYNEPAIQRPQIGAKPTFSKKSHDEIEKPEVGKPLETKPIA